MYKAKFVYNNITNFHLKTWTISHQKCVQRSRGNPKATLKVIGRCLSTCIWDHRDIPTLVMIFTLSGLKAQYLGPLVVTHLKQPRLHRPSTDSRHISRLSDKKTWSSSALQSSFRLFSAGEKLAGILNSTKLQFSGHAQPIKHDHQARNFIT